LAVDTSRNLSIDVAHPEEKIILGQLTFLFGNLLIVSSKNFRDKKHTSIVMPKDRQRVGCEISSQEHLRVIQYLGFRHSTTLLTAMILRRSTFPVGPLAPKAQPY